MEVGFSVLCGSVRWWRWTVGWMEVVVGREVAEQG
jgi:hypothetical protein